MEQNKEEARKAMDIAETKLSKNDYVGAKEFVNKARNLYPKLDGLEQVLMMIDVFISASSNGRGEADWYGILGVDPLADAETIKRQYKRLALLLHPDKNKFNGAEEAFKLILNACSLLSDKVKRSAYDQKRKWSQVSQKKSGMQKKPPNPRSNKPTYEPKSEYDYDHKYESDSESENEYEYDYEPKPKRKHEHKPDKDTFWTVCNRCKTYCELGKANYLNKTMPCPNCNQEFVATEIIPEMINGRPVIRFSFFQRHQEEEQSSDNAQSTSNKNTSDDQ